MNLTDQLTAGVQLVGTVSGKVEGQMLGELILETKSNTRTLHALPNLLIMIVKKR